MRDREEILVEAARKYDQRHQTTKGFNEARKFLWWFLSEEAGWSEEELRNLFGGGDMYSRWPK